MPTASTPYHMPVIVIGTLGLLFAVGAATWANYFYGWSFPASVVGFGVPLLGTAYLLCLLFQKDWTPVSPAVQFEDQLWLAIALMWLGLCVLASVAVAVSTRFGQVVTLGATLGVFVTGLMSNWLLGRRIRDLSGMIDRLAADGAAASAADRAQLAVMKAAYAVLPNSQVFWMSDAVQQKRTIPAAYVLPTAAYGLLMVFAVMCVATALFQRREVG